jgi:deazaflavin-dependent oxidoreductase (nitroreductase family)
MPVRNRVTAAFQKRIANPLMRRVPSQTLLETIGRKSGLPRLTPLGGRLVGSEFWFVSEFGESSQYLRNIRANPRVRLRLRGKWYSGTANTLPDDDAELRLRSLPSVNSLGVRTFGTDLLTLRIDLDGT